MTHQNYVEGSYHTNECTCSVLSISCINLLPSIYLPS